MTGKRADAIVTAADESLLGGGVDRAIHRAAGPGWHSARASPGDAVATRAFDREPAIPAIATGVYGFPADEGARIAVGTRTTTPTRVRLWSG